jgi:tripartite-type tricarboxylate transporter receptor subunit TctC
VTVTRPKLLLATALIAWAPGVLAQDYPTRHITLVGPFQAGGPSDTVARLIAGPMSKVLGQQVVVENVTGAGGTIGSGRVAKSAPDGYTLGISGSGTHAAVEQLYANPPYRAADFESIGLINTAPVIVVAKKDLPPNTLQEFIAYLRANEKTITEADAGVGSVSHLACSVLKTLIAVKPTVASYRGTPQATQDLIAGNVDFVCNQIVNVVGHVKGGALKAYAVTGDSRSPTCRRRFRPPAPAATSSRRGRLGRLHRSEHLGPEIDLLAHEIIEPGRRALLRGHHVVAQIREPLDQGRPWRRTGPD